MIEEPTIKPTDDDEALKKPEFNKEKVLEEALKRHRIATDADHDERALAVDDLEFYNGNQWPESVKEERNNAGRPCLTINRIRGFVSQVVGDLRQNKTAIRVKPENDTSDPKVAKILEGRTRDTESISDAQDAYITGGESAVICGRGFWRVNIEYEDDDSFDMRWVIKPIPNQCSVTWEASAEDPDLTDADYMFVNDLISIEEYETRWPKANKVAFPGTEGDTGGWLDDDRIRIAEYWRKIPVIKTIFLLRDGTVVSEKELQNIAATDPESLLTNPVDRERTVKTYKIQWYKMSGTDILEGPVDWPGKYIPIVAVWGREIYINGKRHVWGLVRDAKDPQLMYNYWRTAAAEVVGEQPREPYLVSDKMIKGHESIWNTAKKSLLRYMTFTPDERVSGGRPIREQPPQLSPGITQESMLAAEELKHVTGIYEPGRGELGPERSGVAIERLQRRTDIANFPYSDNIARAIRHTGRIGVDLETKINDGERKVRVRDVDDSEEFVTINQAGIDEETQEETIMNDITTGKYGVIVTTGPSYATQRMEAADTMLKYMEIDPDSIPLIRDLMVSMLDSPKSDELAGRFRAVQPPQLKALFKAEKEGRDEGAEGLEPDMGMGAGMPEGEMEAEQEGESPEMGEVKLAQEKARLAQEEIKLEGLRLENDKKRVEIEKLQVEKAGVNQ